MMEDGPKRIGRFLKRGSKLTSVVSLTEYSFEQICTAQSINFDNTSRSVIHSRLHEEKELVGAVKQHATFNAKILDAGRPDLPIIMPADFTQDWHKERMNSRRKAMGFEDEDDFDFDQSSIPKKAPPPDDVAHATAAAVVAPPAAAAPPVEVPATTPPIAKVDVPPVATPPVAEKASAEVVATASAVEAPTPKEDFIAYDATAQAASVEDQAVEHYKRRAEVQKSHEQTLNELKEAAKAEGYREGFQVGEEKGVIQAKRTAFEMFSKVGDLIKDFQSLKHDILSNAQKNFYELSQAMGEALLGREFSLNAETYVKVIRRVVTEAVQTNEFKVRVHPETHKKIAALGIKDINDALVSDAAIPIGDFRVESNLTVVEGNVRKIITQLLEQVDQDLLKVDEAS